LVELGRGGGEPGPVGPADGFTEQHDGVLAAALGGVEGLFGLGREGGMGSPGLAMTRPAEKWMSGLPAT
jgi:hypothetical protein